MAVGLTSGPTLIKIDAATINSGLALTVGVGPRRLQTPREEEEAL